MSNEAEPKTDTEAPILDLSPFSIIFDAPERVVEPLSWVEHIPFAYFLVQLLQPRVLVELGVHSGNSYTAFCQAVDTLGLPSSCYGVDTWEGDAHAGLYDNEIYDSLNEFNKTKFTKFSNLMRMTFDEALGYFSDTSIDLLHIDGMHTYDAVRHDFETWLPKMSERGLVLFHDIQVKERDFGVWRLWEELSASYPSIQLRNSHGLGVLFVGSDMPTALKSFFAAFESTDFYGSLFHRLGHFVAVNTRREQALENIQRTNERMQRESLALERRCSGLETSLEQTRERIRTLGDESAGYHRQTQELGQQLHTCRDEAKQLREKNQAMQERINNRTRSMEQMTKEVSVLRQKLESAETRLKTIQSSRVWRWSAPVRNMMRGNDN